MNTLSLRSLRNFIAGSLFVWTASTAPALADDASGPGANAVVAKRNQIVNTAVGQGYFLTAHHAPQWTPNGGVFQFYSGNLGDGAVYWSAKTGAHYIYGSFLEFFRDFEGPDGEAFENGLGYPLEDPKAGTSVGCPVPGTKISQPFIIVGNTNASGKISSTISHLCSDGRGAYLGAVVQS